MLGHHVITLLLCVGALLARWPPVWGLATILTHDSADIALDCLLVAKARDLPRSPQIISPSMSFADRSLAALSPRGFRASPAAAPP